MKFQLIPEEEKGFGWIKETAFEIIREAEATFFDELNDIQKQWDVYSGKFDKNKYDYLTKVDGNLSYPAKMRDVASELVRSKINVLESEQARRKPRFKAVVYDERTLKKKYEERMKAVMDAIEQSVDDQYAYIQSVMQEVQDQQNDLEKQLQVQPENEEAAMQLEGLKANMPAIRLEYGKMLRNLEREGADISDVQAKVAEFRKYNEVEIIETMANAFVKSMLNDSDVRDDFNRSLREKIVTGRPLFFVNYNEKSGKVDFRLQDSIRAYYSRNSSNKWIHRGSEWNATLEYMSITAIASEFDLDDKEIALLRHYSAGNTASISSYNNDLAVFNAKDNLERSRGGIPVWRTWWMSPRQWYWRRSPNPYRPGAFFNHVITDPKKIKKDDIVTKETIFDRYSAVVIGNMICKTKGVDDFVFREKDAPAIPFMPIVGRSYNSESDKPYSLIKRTDDMRELYNIIMYSLELDIVLSGVKGMVMDKSQKPDNMSTKQWMYYRKLGTMWIETMKKGRKVPATFNQFQNYDDSLSDSIALKFEILNGIESLIGKIMGITDPRMGQTVAKDPVHNVMMSQEQSSLITEIQFYETDMVFGQALSLALNLKLQYELKNGKVVNFFNEDLEEVLYKIPAGVMDKSDYTIRAWNNIQEDHMLDIIRQQAAATVQIDGLVALYRVDSLMEMEKRLTEIIVQQEERKSQSLIAIDNNKAQKDQETLKLKAELEQYSLDTKAQIEQSKIELDKVRLQFDMQQKQWENEFKERELQSKTDLELLGISSENQVETEYLNETKRSNFVNEALEAHRLKIEALMNVGTMSLNAQQSHEKNKVDIKKAELSATRRKNNVKD